MWTQHPQNPHHPQLHLLLKALVLQIQTLSQRQQAQQRAPVVNPPFPQPATQQFQPCLPIQYNENLPSEATRKTPSEDHAYTLHSTARVQFR